MNPSTGLIVWTIINIIGLVLAIKFLIRIYKHVSKNKQRLVTMRVCMAALSSYAHSPKQDSLHSLQDERVLKVFQHTTNPATLVQAICPQYGFASFIARLPPVIINVPCSYKAFPH